jgi:hypothetical protein
MKPIKINSEKVKIIIFAFINIAFWIDNIIQNIITMIDVTIIVIVITLIVYFVGIFYDIITNTAFHFEIIFEVIIIITLNLNIIIITIHLGLVQADNTSIDIKWKALLNQENFYKTDKKMDLKNFREKLQIKNSTWSGAVTGFLYDEIS